MIFPVPFKCYLSLRYKSGVSSVEGLKGGGEAWRGPGEKLGTTRAREI